ncbi:hypothetical protein [Bradyrhizobium sp. Tv2a-2]|uniref:hypothetical protein n=1 Tax=Bradyrhizobium sp. Tv2a-2 TaxID=113395 RepID=UPI00042A25A7|nr:hypothetical protein [Bradyrhizobium sp. Tv2a-2]
MSAKSWWSVVLTGAAAVLGSLIGGYSPAIAGSDNDPRTYAGDYQGGSLPIGTFIAFQYASYSRADAFVDPTGRALPDSHANTWVEFTRVTYFAEFANRPLVIEADLPLATLTDVNIPGTNNQVAGGLVDPVVHLTYFLISDAKLQRWFGFTNFFWLPWGRDFDNRSAVNVSTPRQFTDTPQFGYTEGLGKISSSLNGFFFDLIANASFHTDGDSPLEVVNPPGAPLSGVLTYETLTQRPSYDVKAFLRYNPSTFLFAAVGIEKSWGGEQIGTNGRFFVAGLPVAIPQPNVAISRDDFLRGHFQFQIPLAKDFTIAGDVFHDFQATGGFRENIGVEVRLAKFFFPSSRPN